MEKIQQCQEKLGEKKVEIERLLMREKQIRDDFTAAIANSNTQDALVRIFKKKIKRKKVPAPPPCNPLCNPPPPHGGPEEKFSFGYNGSAACFGATLCGAIVIS